MEILNFPQDQQMEALYSIMGQYPNYLDGLTLVDTPLHYAAAHGRTLLAVEMLQRSPSLGFKLNPAGLSPLHLAIRNGHLETVRSLIRNNPELIGVQGREGITPLHHVAEIGDADLLGEFLMTFPDAIDKLTIRGESAIHLAVKNQKFDSFGVLLVGYEELVGEMFSGGEIGRTTHFLHVAAETNQKEVIKILIKERVSLSNKNADGLTALDITTEKSIKEMLHKKGAKQGHDDTKDPKYSDYFKEELTRWEKLCRVIWFLDIRLSTEHRNVILVVAALICTATFQAIVNPPTTFPDKIAKINFVLQNALSFVTSAGMIHILLPSRYYNLMLTLGLTFLMFAYASLVSIFAEHIYFYYVLMVIFSLIHFLKIKITSMKVLAPSSIRDVLPSMNRTSMIMRCVQMDTSVV